MGVIKCFSVLQLLLIFDYQLVCRISQIRMFSFNIQENCYGNVTNYVSQAMVHQNDLAILIHLLRKLSTPFSFKYYANIIDEPATAHMK